MDRPNLKVALSVNEAPLAKDLTQVSYSFERVDGRGVFDKTVITFFRRGEHLLMEMIGTRRYFSFGSAAEEKGSALYHVLSTSQNEFLVRILARNVTIRNYDGSEDFADWQVSKFGPEKRMTSRVADKERDSIYRLSLNDDGLNLADASGTLYSQDEVRETNGSFADIDIDALIIGH